MTVLNILKVLFAHERARLQLFYLFGSQYFSTLIDNGSRIVFISALDIVNDLLDMLGIGIDLNSAEAWILEHLMVLYVLALEYLIEYYLPLF